ncbi:MAG: metal ABC transporter substrate-binding protein [Nitrospirota bacterium]
MRKLILIVLMIVFTSVAHAEERLNVVTTLPWIGSLAKELGKDRVSVTTLVKPSQDPHMLEAKPSMILAARKADIIMYNGLDLEIGYLPLIFESSKNPSVMPGRPGNFDCSRFVRVIEKPATVDRSMGDVHPLGNPHYHFSPENVLKVAEGMAAALGDLDQANADFYRANFEAFAVKLREKQKQWSSQPLSGKRFIAYHRLFEYLATDFGFRIIGYVESKPGIPPSAAHIERLMEDMKKSRPDGILTTSLYGKKEAESLSTKTGVRVIVLPNDVGAGKGTADWFAFMDATLKSLL